MKKSIFKKLGGLFLGLAMGLGVAVGVTTGNKASEVMAVGKTDVIDNSATSTNLSGSATSSWVTDFDLTCSSGASYKIHSMGTKGGTHALQWNNKGFLYQTKTSSDNVEIVSVKAITNSKKITIYGSDAAFTGNSGGTSIGDVTGTSTLDCSGKGYKYIRAVGTASSTQVTSITVTYKEPVSTYSVTYNANGATSGSVPTDNTSYNANASVTVLGNTGNLSKTNYMFDGWNSNTDGTGTDYEVGTTFNISGNTTLYAKWKESTNPTISVPSTFSGYVGETKEISISYANLTSGLNVSSSSDIIQLTQTSDNGNTRKYNVKFLSQGTATLSCKDGETQLASCAVSSNKVTITSLPSSKSIKQGKSETLTATVAAGSINWSSNNSKVTVDNNGVVTVASDATANSIAIITATSTIDSSVSATCTITVESNPFAEFTILKNVSDVTTDAVYALSADGIYWAGSYLYNKMITAVSNSGGAATSINDVGYFKLEVNTGYSGGYKLKKVVKSEDGLFSDATGNNYIDYTNDSTNLSCNTNPNYFWEPFAQDGNVSLRLLTNNRYLGWNNASGDSCDPVSASNSIKAYTNPTKNTPVYLWKVEQKQIVSISINKNPVNLSYATNDTFDPSGLSITLKFDDDSTAEVPYSGNESKFSFSPSLTTQLTASGSITIGYGGQTTTVDYTVNSHQLSFASTEPSVLEVGETHVYKVNSHTFNNSAVSENVTYQVINEKDEIGSDTTGVIQYATSTNNVTAKKAGTATIKATCQYGGETTFDLQVVKMHANEIVPSTKSITVAEGLTSDAITVTFKKDGEDTIPTNKKFSVVSNDTSIATVGSSTNKVTGVKTGETTLTVKADADDSIFATINVTVTDAYVNTFYAPTSTVFEEGQILNETLESKTSTQLKVSKTNQNSSAAYDVTMSENTKAFVSDTEEGTYTELAMNTVLDSSYNGKYIKFSYTESGHTVQTNPKTLEVYYIHMLQAGKAKTLKVGQSYTFVKGTDYETNCNDLTWSISKGSDYATVSEGVLTITKMPQNYVSYDITVSVKSASKTTINDQSTVTISYQDVTNVTISESEIDISKDGTSYQLTAEVIGSNCRKDITWVTEDEEKATVTQTGKVKVADGVLNDCSVNVYAYVDENLNGKFDAETEKRAVCTVNVKLGAIDANEIVFEEDSFEAFHSEVYDGLEIELAPTIGPINATVKALHWTTSDTAVAKLANYSNAQSKTIILTGASGKADITATTTNESGKQVSATYKIEIIHDDIGELNLNTNNVCKYFETNSTFNYTGLTASINYDANTALNPKDVTDSITVTAPDMATTGEKDVVVTYVEDGETVTNSYKITVADRALQSIEWISQPTKKTYYVGDTFSLDGLNIKANYNFAPNPVTINKSTDGLTSSIDDGYVIKDSDVERLNGKNVTVSFGGESLTYTINVKENFSNTIIGKNYVPGSYSPTTTQIESLADIEEGTKVVLKNDTDSQFVTGYSDKDATITTTAADALIFTVIKSGDNFKLSCTYSNSTYYVQTESSNQFHLTTTSSNAASISFDSNGNLKLGSRFLCKNGSYYRQYNSIGTYHVFNLYSCAASSGTWGNTNTPYSDEGEALAFARKYLHLLTNDGTYYDASGNKLPNLGVCDAQSGHDDGSFVSDIWAQMTTEFSSLSENSQRMLIFAADNGEAGTNSIEKFVSLYDYIVSRYETKEFIGRKGANTFVQKINSNRINPIVALNKVDNSVWIISAVAVAGLTAIGGYFFYKKRKEI